MPRRDLAPLSSSLPMALPASLPGKVENHGIDAGSVRRAVLRWAWAQQLCRALSISRGANAAPFV